mgnify:CR=1 FL=1
MKWRKQSQIRAGANGGATRFESRMESPERRASTRSGDSGFAERRALTRPTHTGDTFRVLYRKYDILFPDVCKIEQSLPITFLHLKIQVIESSQINEDGSYGTER